MATCAELVRAPLPENAAENSASLLPALLGRTREPIRNAVVNHSLDGSFAIRQGRWKLAMCADTRN